MSSNASHHFVKRHYSWQRYRLWCRAPGAPWTYLPKLVHPIPSTQFTLKPYSSLSYHCFGRSWLRWEHQAKMPGCHGLIREMLWSCWWGARLWYCNPGDRLHSRPAYWDAQAGHAPTPRRADWQYLRVHGSGRLSLMPWKDQGGSWQGWHLVAGLQWEDTWRELSPHQV